jgi:hypothetical protein
MRGDLGLRDIEDVGLKAIPVRLAVPEKTGIISAVLDVLPAKLRLRSLPGFECHTQIVEVASLFGYGTVNSPRKRAYSSAVRAGDS